MRHRLIHCKCLMGTAPWRAASVLGRRVDIGAGAGEQLVITGGFVGGHGAILANYIAEFLGREALEVSIAEDDVELSGVSCVWPGAVRGEGVCGVGDIGFGGDSRGIDDNAFVAPGVAVFGAVVVVAGALGFGFSCGGAHAIESEDGDGAFDGTGLDGVVGGSFVGGAEARVAEELEIIAEGVIAVVVPVGDGWAEEPGVVDGPGVVVDGFGGLIGVAFDGSSEEFVPAGSEDVFAADAVDAGPGDIDGQAIGR